MKRSYTIHEISKLYNIGKDSLRYYEKLGILCPKRNQNGYRMYTTRDIYRLNVIKDMRSLGFSMSQIQEYLDHRSVDNSIFMFEQEMEIIDKKIIELNQMKETMQACLDELKKSKDMVFDTFEIVSLPVRKCVTLKDSFESEEDIDFLLTKLSSQYESALFAIGNCNTGLVYDMEKAQYASVIVMGDTLVQAEYEWPAGNYLVCNMHGKMGETTIQKMQQYAKEHDIQLDAHALELFIIDSHETSNHEEYISQIQIRLED